MLWVGTSWKMNHNLPETKKYLNILIKNSKYLTNPKINSVELVCDIETSVAFKGFSVYTSKIR